MDEKIAQWSQVAEAARTKINRIYSFITIGEVQSKYHVKAYIKTLEDKYSEFENAVNQLIFALPAKKDIYNNELVTIEELYFDCYANLHRLLDEYEKQTQSSSKKIDDNKSIILSSPSLPQAPLPTFDGKYENWFKFKALFTDIMSKYPNESDTTKLYHLDKALINDAACAIDQQTLNDNNYEGAWKILTERYENMRTIVDIHINGLLNLKNVTKTSARELDKAVSTCVRHVDALKFHKKDLTGMSEILIINLLTSKLDHETRKLWEATIDHGKLPTYNETIKFLKARSSILERVEIAKNVGEASVMKSKLPINNKFVGGKVHIASTTESSCEICNEDWHLLYKCDQFKTMTPDERFAKVKKIGLCFNCLQSTHKTFECKSKSTCYVCNKKHHTLLHLQNQAVTANINAVENIEISNNENEVNIAGSSVCSATATKQILLSTAIVYINDINDTPCMARVLLDSGSQLNFISEQMASTLGLKREKVNVPITGINQTTTNAKFQLQACIKARVGSYKASLKFLIVPKVTCTLPQVTFDVEKWPIPIGVQLADPHFNLPDRIDILIGAELFFDMITGEQIKIGLNLPILQETRLGWIVSGPVNVCNLGVSHHAVCHHCSEYTDDQNLDDILRKFWEIEECTVYSKQSKEDQLCESHFIETYQRDESGRYQVMLPFKETKLKLGHSKANAMRRFERLEMKLNAFPDIKQQYVDFINEYIELGHCKVIEIEEQLNNDTSFYLPHHCVIKPGSSTTRLRVVFDASAKSSTNTSLNDLLMIGPVVQEELFSIVMRFRTLKYVFTADLCKMYRQIRVHPTQTGFQKILWRENSTEPVKTIELSTVTYGTACAAFLATRVLNQLAADEGDNFPKAVKTVKEDFYVDDVLSGAQTIDEAVEKQGQLIDLLKCGGFSIHKWCSNTPELLSNIPIDAREKVLKFEDRDANETIRTLGLLWNPVTDEFVFCVNNILDESKLPTKRIVLSGMAKLFDPLGLLGPTILVAKLLMQDLWKLELTWDEQLPIEQAAAWNNFCSQLSLLHDLKIPRLVMNNKNADKIEIYGFADSSLHAYGACVYICVWRSGIPHLKLQCSKSKVAPIKSKTPEELKIPRLELNAALLLSNLIKKVNDSIRIEHNGIKLCSDSKIVLSWLQKSPLQLNIFVANRVEKILNLTADMKWYYIPTKQNPADIISRGQYPSDLLNNNLWWNGPTDFIASGKLKEKCEITICDTELPETRNEILVLPAIQNEPFAKLYKFSSYRKTQRILAYVMRFINNTKKNTTKNYDTLKIFEIRKATTTLLRMVQTEKFGSEFRDILTGNRSSGNKLLNLNPFIDSDGIIRVGGRIKNAMCSYDKRHQIVLPDKHHITNILIDALHKENLHVGQSGLLAIVRQRYWPVHAKKIIREYARKCVACFRLNPRKIEQFMGDLPGDRVNPASPFIKTGVDYAGPIFLRQKQRKSTAIKAYLAIFVCMVTKAIHIELVSDMTTDAFIAALQRFVNRRGNVSDLYSDNGSNFIGAKNTLHELFILFKSQQNQAAVDRFCDQREIIFHFIPPRAPNFGGLWESAVKSVKRHLKSVIGENTMTYEEMNTLLIQIEGILNSRPLIAQSDDANDLSPITPAHFLIGREMTAIPEPSYESLKTNTLSIWQLIQLKRQHFWKRWSSDYLTQLQQRSKWFKDRHEIKVGMLVVIREDNLPPHKWMMGRILELLPGSDDIVRVVSLRTSSGICKRPVNKLSILPIDVETDVSTGGVCTKVNT